MFPFRRETFRDAPNLPVQFEERRKDAPCGRKRSANDTDKRASFEEEVLFPHFGTLYTHTCIYMHVSKHPPDGQTIHHIRHHIEIYLYSLTHDEQVLLVVKEGQEMIQISVLVLKKYFGTLRIYTCIVRRGCSAAARTQ